MQDLSALQKLISNKYTPTDSGILMPSVGVIPPPNLNNLKTPIMGSTELLNVSSALVDGLQGDMGVFGKQLEYVDIKKLKLALDFILNNENLSDNQKLDLLTNSWRIYYKTKPPSPEEFLTEKYIGKQADETYPRVRKWFLDFMDPSTMYRHAVLYPFIGAGKSTLAVLINLYITVHMSLMRNPKAYLGVATSSVLAFVLCSYNLKKAQEVLLDPFINILEGSEYFEKLRTKEDMIKREAKYRHESEADHIFWTTASKNGVSALQFGNSLNYKLASNPNAILGLTIICGTMTELAFFREAGKGDDYIWRFFNDIKTRVWSRMKQKSDPTGINYWGRSILDSSPNDLESPIDHYCMFDADKDPLNYVVKGSHWKWVPEDYDDINDQFPIFMGSNGKPPMILQTTEGFEPQDILMVPRIHYQKFHDDLRKSLKDLAGIPQGSLDKLFYDFSKIEMVFEPKLKNIEVCLKADARQSPTELLWRQFRDDLFVRHGSGYHFWYKPKLPRVFHIDQSLTGDMAAVAFCHVERKYPELGNTLDVSKDLIYVIDFIIPIHPYGGRINLDAIKEVITDVYGKGQMPILKGSYDNFQSEASIQYLERYGLEMDQVSVDKTMDPYLFLAQLVETGNLKIGRNVFFKNNLKSLRIVPRKLSHTLKVDHTLGDNINPVGADISWEGSMVGLHAKDVSDAVAGAVYQAKKYLSINPQSLGEYWDEDRIIVTPAMLLESTIDQLDDMGLSWVS
jgi:hypothetical protein